MVFLDVNGLVGRVGKWIRKYSLYRAIKLSKKIFTVSKFSKKRIEHHFGDKKEIIVKKLAVINISEVIRNNNYELYLQKIKPHNNDNLILAPVNFKGKFWTVALEKNDMHISSWIDFDPY